MVRADVNPDPSATVVLSPDIVICNPLDNGKDPASEKAALRLAIRQTYSEYMVHYEASKGKHEFRLLPSCSTLSDVVGTQTSRKISHIWTRISGF